MARNVITVVIIANRIVTVPTTGFGGIERFLYLFILQLLALGVRVILMCAEGSYMPGVEVVPLAQPRMNTDFTDYVKMSVSQVGKACEWVLSRADVDVVHDNTGFGALHAYALNVPMVSTLHNGVEQALFFNKEFTTNVTNMALTNSDLNILRGAEIPVRDYIYYDVDVDYLVNESVWQPPEKKLLFMGRRNPGKGLHNAISIARQTGYQLLIAGPQPEEQYHDWYATDVEPFIDGEQIVDVGLVSDSQKVAFFQGAAGFVMANQCYENPIGPSWYEPFGVVAIEGMAAGVAVIGTYGAQPNVGSLPELVLDKGYLFESRSDEETVERGVQAVRSLIHSPEQFQRRQARALDFRSGTAARRYLEVYRSVLNA
jgi:glycosyltransferase involved in cell wall biosynthesis